MAAPTKDAVLEALKQIKRPGKSTDIVSEGCIQGLVLKDGHIGFAIEVEPATATDQEPVRKACEQVVQKLPGVLSVSAVLTAHNAAPGTPSSEPQKKAPPQNTPQDIPGIKKIIAVASGKGGVGKSTVAVNLSVALAHLGKKIGLLDADIYGPSIPQMLGLKDKPQSDGKKIIPLTAHGIKTMSIGFLVEEGRAMIWRGPMVMSALTQMLTDVDWGELDILVVDMPPGTGDAQLTLAQRVPLAGAVIVSTPQEIALADVRRGIAMFEKTHVPILGLVENMAYFMAPGTNEKSYIFGEGGVRRTADQANLKLLGEIPLTTRVRELSDNGQPITAIDPTSTEAAPFMEIASQVIADLEQQTAPAFPRIVIEDD